MRITSKFIERLEAVAAETSPHGAVPQWHEDQRCPSRTDLVLFALGLIPKRWREALIEHLVDCERCRTIHDSLLVPAIREQSKERRRHARRTSSHLPAIALARLARTKAARAPRHLGTCERCKGRWVMYVEAASRIDLQRLLADLRRYR